MTDGFRHPTTGELLATREDFTRALIDVDREIDAAAGNLYALRRRLREELGVRFEAELPRPRDRSATQEKVATCPRCGGRVE